MPKLLNKQVAQAAVTTPLYLALEPDAARPGAAFLCIVDEDGNHMEGGALLRIGTTGKVRRVADVDGGYAIRAGITLDDEDGAILVKDEVWSQP